MSNIRFHTLIIERMYFPHRTQARSRAADWPARATAGLALVASLVVPIAVAWVGGRFNESIKESENRVRYVELAIAQLRAAPATDTSALRDWAIELLDSQAPVKLSGEAKAQLKIRPLEVPLSAQTESSAVARGELAVQPRQSVTSRSNQQ
jgi:hypothetical protein